MVIRCERWFGKCWLLQAGGIGGVGRWGIDVSNRPYQLPSKTCKGGESKWRMLGARVRLECTAIMNTVHSLKGITCLLEQRMNSWGPPPPSPRRPPGVSWQSSLYWNRPSLCSIIDLVFRWWKTQWFVLSQGLVRYWHGDTPSFVIIQAVYDTYDVIGVSHDTVDDNQPNIRFVFIGKFLLNNFRFLLVISFV